MDLNYIFNNSLIFDTILLDVGLVNEEYVSSILPSLFIKIL